MKCLTFYLHILKNIDGISTRVDYMLMMMSFCWATIVDYVSSLNEIKYFEEYVHRNLILSRYQMDKTMECIFITQRNLPLPKFCQNTIDRVGWSGIVLLQMTIIPHKILVDSTFLIFLGIFLHIILSFLLYLTDRKSILWKYYFFNPLVILSVITHPFSSPSHVKIVLLLFFASSFKSVFLCIILMTDLILSKSVFITILPFIYSILQSNRIHDNDKSKHKSPHIHRPQIYIFLSFLLILAIIYYIYKMFCSKDEVVFVSTILTIKDISQYFTISSIQDEFYELNLLGIWWYVQLEVFKEFAPYILNLIQLQPWLYVLPIFRSISSSQPMIAVHLMLSIIFYFDSHLTYGDLGLCLAYLLSHNEVIDHMRFKSWIVAGILIPLVLTPIMFDLWLIKGSGNANFVFFQGLIMWLFGALGIIEFTQSLLQQIFNQKSNYNLVQER